MNDASPQTTQPEETGRKSNSTISDSADGGGKARWRTALSVVCLIVACLLVPTSIVGGWARAQLVDEAAFVETFAPLAQDPAVQDFIVDQSTEAVLEAVSVEVLTDDVFQGLSELDLPPKAAESLNSLQGVVVTGVRSAVESSIDSAVTSPAFAAVWQSSLKASHKAMVATLTLDEEGTVVLDPDGELGIQLGPIVESLKQQLVDEGYGFADKIPAVDRIVTVAQADALVLAGTVYSIATTVGYLLPWVTLGLLIAGVFLARRRANGVIGAGIAISVGAGVLALSLWGASTYASASSPEWGVPSQTMDAIVDTIIGAMRDSAVATLLLGIVIAFAGWLGSGSSRATSVRTAGSEVSSRLRQWLQSHGFNTGGFGDFVYQYRTLLGVLIITACLAIAMLVRPLSVGNVVGVVTFGLVCWFLLSVLQRRPQEASTEGQTVPSSS